ncbi:class I SAM-dependent methyltransferase [Nocardioides humi]|uniref:Class I SAM-dependent methyltransferase n=1 Tax=Nocardioides humi TaxID=449461 RepID=A0ABN2AK15_9ACTN|nr:class I SAM-dependent methyltransferase [Nocardioides humi]
MSSSAAFELVFAHALQGEACTIRTPDSAPVPLPIEDWTRSAGPVDRLFLRHCAGATIDVGCGPGRLTAELAVAGHVALGIDIVHEAVDQTRRRGGAALHRDVFDRLPGEGRWDTVLLADGNVGIGGDPPALLTRLRTLLRAGGRIVVEVEPPGRPTGSADVQLACRCAVTTFFRWGRVGVDGLPALAARVGLVLRAIDRYDERWCAVLGVDR